LWTTQSVALGLFGFDLFIFAPALKFNFFGIEFNGAPIGSNLTEAQKTQVQKKIQEAQAKSPAKRLARKQQQIFIVAMGNQFLHVDLSAVGLEPGGPPVVIFDSQGSRAAFDYYAKRKIPGVALVRKELQGYQISHDELKNAISPRADVFSIAFLPPGFEFRQLKELKSAVRGEAYLATTPWLPTAQVTLLNALVRYLPKELGERVSPELLEREINVNGPSLVRVPQSREKNFVEAYLSILNQGQVSERELEKAA